MKERIIARSFSFVSQASKVEFEELYSAPQHNEFAGSVIAVITGWVWSHHPPSPFRFHKEGVVVVLLGGNASVLLYGNDEEVVLAAAGVWQDQVTLEALISTGLRRL